MRITGLLGRTKLSLAANLVFAVSDIYYASGNKLNWRKESRYG